MSRIDENELGSVTKRRASDRWRGAAAPTDGQDVRKRNDAINRDVLL